jgi:hypothetical protein
MLPPAPRMDGAGMREESLMRLVLLACSVALLALVAAGPAWADDDDRGHDGAI